MRKPVILGGTNFQQITDPSTTPDYPGLGIDGDGDVYLACGDPLEWVPIELTGTLTVNDEPVTIDGEPITVFGLYSILVNESGSILIDENSNILTGG